MFGLGRETDQRIDCSLFPPTLPPIFSAGTQIYGPKISRGELGPQSSAASMMVGHNPVEKTRIRRLISLSRESMNCARLAAHLRLPQFKSKFLDFPCI
jgi:hypothetical protein